ncbi:MAG: N-acetylmuramoyl-L-alanine amidase [Prevotella sp.]|nr:N-acetylmuramoyl-L-alanine amidase [Prevotella sp.]
MKHLNRNNVKLLIIHCSATKVSRPFSVENLISTGIARFGQPSYHYYIRMDGEVIPILPENVRGAHAKHYNSCSLGICYEGGLDVNGRADDTRTQAQKDAMYSLLKDLREEYPEARIIGHCELPHVIKTCPNFLASEYYSQLNGNQK